MKVRRLVLDDDSYPESRRIVRKDCSSQETWSVEKAAKSKDEPIRKKSCTKEGRSTSVEKSQALRRDKGKAMLIEDVPLKRRDVHVERTQRKGLRAEAAEVLTVSSHTEKDPVALEEVAAKAMEAVVVLLLQYLDRKREKYAEGNLSESYVEIVRNRMRVKRELALEVADKEQRS
ncbi:hypothetical protein AXG93_4610s1000 [Marchantia polymorpha subsp. ruderalis]|uniref:Uncharacterized protein n=1 Tax=Marchantia polymorpha subsp. ruderalis TaxID=1480154 RepID=A0A176W4G0_MARPO|nr:hypothetical protein AXG93_4610s1000 [Marchantia polymorpha subsp. ruderalis]